MRITGGETKGRRIKSPKGMRIRPTTDKVREAIFSIIGQNLSGIRVWDCFAGTGSLGLEALSRGAAFAIFTDSSSHAITLIQENLAICGYLDKAMVLKKDLNKHLDFGRGCIAHPFDLVFLDPPYGEGYIPALMEKLLRVGLFSKHAMVVTETAKSEPPLRGTKNLRLMETRRYGDTVINLYE